MTAVLRDDDVAQAHPSRCACGGGDPERGDREKRNRTAAGSAIPVSDFGPLHTFPVVQDVFDHQGMVGGERRGGM